MEGLMEVRIILRKKYRRKTIKFVFKNGTRKQENKAEKVKSSDIAVMTLDLTQGLMKLGEKGQSFEDKYAGKVIFRM